MVQIIPAILASSEEEYRNKLTKIKASGAFESGWVQIDLMDNKFVQNKSIEPKTIAKFPVNLKIEAHLMVEYPENWIDELVKIQVARIIFPIEDRAGIPERIEHIKNHGIQVGLSVNPETKISEVAAYMNDLDAVLVMSVNPGFGGQEFFPEILEKIKECFRWRLDNKGTFKIGVDGGISTENVKLVVDAGADYLVMGSHLIDGDIDENLENLWEAL